MDIYDKYHKPEPGEKKPNEKAKCYFRTLGKKI